MTTKSFVLCLNKHSKDPSLISQVEKQVFNSLLPHTTTGAGNNLLLPVTQTLAQASINPDQLNSEIFSKLTEFLKNMAEEEFIQNDAVVPSILKLLRDKCKSYSTDTAEVMRNIGEAH